MGANARRAQPLVQRPRPRRLRVRNGQHAHLLGGEPERERPREVLDQEADEPLQRAEDRAVDHDRSMRPVVLTRVLESEALGLLEIELDRGALPLAADGDRKSTRLNSSHGYISYAV